MAWENYESSESRVIPFLHPQVRSSARACYRVYKRLWPDRARRIYSLLDPAVQKVSILVAEVTNILTSTGIPISAVH